jgi:AcrR family transcriptional regulator
MKAAALETLASHGFSGLTLEKICERAGVPRATSIAAGPRL